VLGLINGERTYTLAVKGSLNASAARRCADMRDKGYWSHERLSEFLSSGGEILARGFTDIGQQHSAWMASATHKAVIIDNRYRYFGMATCSYLDGRLITVVHFS
jgi:uncharacterized protein YkwD